MKKTILTAFLVLASTVAQAKTILSEKDKMVSPSDIDQVVRLVDKKDAGSMDKKLSIVVSDRGMSTDISPRYTIYLGYASLAEMGNITVNFEVSDQAFKFISASRKAAGIYEVKTMEYREDGMYAVTTTIDATKIFSDEKKARETCGGDFCDQVLKSSISTSEKAIKQ